MMRKSMLFCFLICIGVPLSMGASSDDPISNWHFMDSDPVVQTGVVRSLALAVPDDVRLSATDIQALADSESIEVLSRNSDTVTLLSRDRTAFDEDGYTHLIQQEAVLIITDKGVEESAVVNLHYGLPYERLRLLDAGIISPDGTKTTLTGDQVMDIPDSEDAAVNIYEPVWRLLVLTFPRVEPGAILYYTYEECAVRSRMPGALNWGHTFRSTEPVISASICMRGPVTRPLKWFVANDPDGAVSFTEESSGTFITYCWNSREMPAIDQEPGMIPVSELTTSLLVTTETWEEFSRREAAIIEPNLEPDDAIRKKVQELTAGLTDPEEKLKVLFRYVTGRVRYMGVAFGDRPGMNPDPVSRTFANNAGVCKDKAGLLTAMLRLSGIEAYYTLNNPSRHIHDQVAVDQFNHAIVAVRFAGDTAFRYLDVTTDLEITMCPASSGGTGVLRIDANGADPGTIPISPADKNMGWIEATGTLEKSGRFSSTVNYRGTGVRDALIRGPFYYIEPSKHDEFAGYFVQQIHSAAQLDKVRVLPEKLEDLSRPVTMLVTYHIDQYMAEAGNYALFKIPGTLLPFDWIYWDLKDYASLSTRQWPLNLDSNSGMQITETVTLPAGYTVKVVPDPVLIDQGGIFFSQNHTFDDITVTLNQVLKVNKPRISPDEFPAFKQAVTGIKQSVQAYVILEAIQ